MPQDLRALARDLRRTAKAVADATNETTAKVANDVLRKAIRQSSGPGYPKSERPYAKRHGKPLRDPSTINVGAGEFRRSWVVESVPGANGILRRGVANRSEVADYLERGTRTMFARPLKEILETEARRSWERHAPGAYERALTTAFSR